MTTKKKMTSYDEENEVHQQLLQRLFNSINNEYI